MISFEFNKKVSKEDFIQVLKKSGLGVRRPMENEELLSSMLANSNFVISARHNDEIVGILRGLSDFCYRTFIADLAVIREFQGQGIGRGLINEARIHSPGARLFLFSAEDAEGFYQKIGFQRHQRCYQLNSDSLLL